MIGEEDALGLKIVGLICLLWIWFLKLKQKKLGTWKWHSGEARVGCQRGKTSGVDRALHCDGYGFHITCMLSLRLQNHTLAAPLRLHLHCLRLSPRWKGIHFLHFMFLKIFCLVCDHLFIEYSSYRFCRSFCYGLSKILGHGVRLLCEFLMLTIYADYSSHICK